jgi:hypothetical protein
MYSDAADQRASSVDFRAALPRPCPSARWEHFPYSEISHHGGACCDVARHWITAMDFAQLNGGSLTSGPRWLREKYEWGPSEWPIHWCEAVGRKVIDCGAHSALAHEVFQARGLTAVRAQFVQTYSADAMEQWRRKWVDAQVCDHWLGDDAIYHEGNALLTDGNEVKLWDGSAGWWINRRHVPGYGGLAAVRILAPGREAAEPFRWGQYLIEPNVWTAIVQAWIDPPLAGQMTSTAGRVAGDLTDA